MYRAIHFLTIDADISLQFLAFLLSFFQRQRENQLI